MKPTLRVSRLFIPQFAALLLSLKAEPTRLSAEQASSLCEVAPSSPFPEVAGSYSALLQKATPAVVSVFPAMILEESGALPPIDRFFGKQADDKNAPHERIMGVGSGVIISPNGWIITNSHVVHLESGKVADKFFVELYDHRRFSAEVAGFDEATDLALLKIEARDLSPIKFADSNDVQTGDRVFAIGNPFKVGMTATMGMVSATRRSNLAIGGESAYQSYIQTDAAINPGNSGGALLDISARLVGINTAIWGSGGGNVGIGFAIPVNLVREITSQLAEHGSVTRGFFGIQSMELTEDVANKNNLPRMAGAVVESVMSDGPAAKAGIIAGDIVIKAANQPVIYRGDLRYELSRIRPGGKITLTCWRDGVAKDFNLTAAAEVPQGKGEIITLDHLPGVKFSQSSDIVKITEVNSTKLRKAGLEIGMVMLEVNGTHINSLEILKISLRSGMNQIKVRNQDSTLTLAIEAE